MTDLLSRLNNDPNVTNADVLAFLEERAVWGRAQGGQVTPLDQFWRPEDLDHYRAAVAWWPKDAPPMHGRPYLGVMCSLVVRQQGAEPTTFYQDLLAATERVCAWIKEQGGDVANPNETKEQRQRRKGREAVARHRKMAESGDPLADEVKRCYALYIEACQTRKAAEQAARDEHTPAVDEAKAAWEHAKFELEHKAQCGQQQG